MRGNKRKAKFKVGQVVAVRPSKEESNRRDYGVVVKTDNFTSGQAVLLEFWDADNNTPTEYSYTDDELRPLTKREAGL